MGGAYFAIAPFAHPGQREAAVVNVVEVGHEEQQIGRLLHRKETGAGHVDA